MHLLAVAEPQLHRRPSPGRLGEDRLEPAPVVDNLPQPLDVRIVGTRPALLDSPPPEPRRLGVLSAVFEDSAQMPQRAAVQAPLVPGQLTIHLYIVELRRQGQPFHAAGQLGDGLVFLQRVKLPCAGFLRAGGISRL